MNIYSLLGLKLLETSCLEKITVCVIETMLMTLPLVQMNKARKEVIRKNQAQAKINIVKGLQTSVIHLIPGSISVTTNCRSRHSRVFLVKPVLKIS